MSPTAAKTKAERTAACCLVSRPVRNPDGTQAALCLVAPPGHTRHGSFAAGFITSILPQASCEQYRDGRGASAKLAWLSGQRVSEGSLRADLRHRGRPGGLSTSLRQSSVASFTGFTNSNAQARQRCGYARPIAPRVCQSTQRCGRHRGPPVPGCPGGTARGWLLPSDRAGRGSQLRAGALRLLVAVCAKTQRHWASAGFSPLTRNKVATNRQHRSGASNQWGGCGPKGCTAPKCGFHHRWTTRHTGESYCTYHWSAATRVFDGLARLRPAFVTQAPRPVLLVTEDQPCVHGSHRTKAAWSVLSARSG